MAAALTWTDADSNATNLHDGTIFKLLDITGAGIPPLDNQSVRTPLQDGETYLRTLLDPRFVTLRLMVAGTSFEDFYANRRTLIVALNPKLGEGTLKYKPNSGGVQYGLDGYVERVRSSKRSDRVAIVDVMIRAPDPTWYNVSQNVPNISVTPTQLAFPITFPIQFGPKFNSSVINNGGDVVSWPVILNDDGGFTGPKFENTTTSKYINLPTLTVASGEVLTVDMKARTIKVDGTSVLSYLTSDSEFWTLALGNNTVKISLLGITTNPTFSLNWYTRYLGI